MAALLKKRALAEFSHVIQEEAKPPQKKLRLTHIPPKPQEPPINLKECNTTAEILEQLFKLENSLPIPADITECVISQMKVYFYPEQDEVVKSTIVSLLGKLGQLPNIDSSYVCDDIINWLKSESSHKLISQIISSLAEIGSSLPYESTLHQRLANLAVKHLRDSSHLVRCKCLELIGCLGSPDAQIPSQSGPSQDSENMQSIMGNFTTDNDPRVRSSAFRAMLTWHERGLSIEKGAYKQACAALKDDYEGVRLSAVKLVWVLSQLYPECMVPVSGAGDSEIRLVDDGFATICNMVNDVSMKVRAVAAGLLGSLRSVSPRFLEQTLDKKLMSNMRRKTSAHQRQKEHYESGEWATGQKWADDAPKEDMDPDSVSVMSSGACGAFVHGLEDEFLEVRHAAIDSLCELATRYPMFAILSQDFLVDMLNDEIDTVRLNAINSLRKMSEHIVVREDQLDGILGVLKDFSFEIREALRSMFCNTKLGSKACLNTCVLALLDNMRRYPADRESIWNCMRHLGEKHAFLVMSMAPDLMSCHPYFESIEPDVDDPSYISILLLVFNATVKCPTMSSLFPEYAVRHYNYLRDTLPNLVPTLELNSDVTAAHDQSASSEASTATFLEDTLKRLEGLNSMDTQSALQLLDIGIRDLHSIPHLSPKLSATAKCHDMFLQCHKLLLKMISAHIEPVIGDPRMVDDTVMLSNIEQVYQLTNQLEHSFLGLGTAAKLQVKELRLRAQTLQLLLQMCGRSVGSKAACVDYLQIMNSLQRQFTKTGLQPEAFTNALLSETHHLESCELPTFLPILESSLKLHKCGMMKLDGKVKQAHGCIIEPSGLSDNVLKFIAGMTMGVDVVAMVENIDKVEDVCVRVKYPDQQVHYTSPKPSDIRQLGALKHRLITQVLVSHSKWSEPCAIEVCLVLRYKAGHTIRGKQDSNTSSSSSAVAYIELCKPVKVLIAPSGEKR